MHKVAILTLYYKNYNYGGILQAYALQNAIENMGYSSEQISYRLTSGYKDLRHLKLSMKFNFVYLYNFIKHHKWVTIYNNQRKMMENFAFSIPHSKTVNAYNINKISRYYDCFVCGSDQIWNPIGWQPTLFLDFVSSNKIKISYAASLARDNLTKEQLDFIKKHVNDFVAISVREKKSADILNKFAPELNVQYMPDPVFLLGESKWKKFIKRPDNNKPYIFGYFLGNNNVNREKALAYAKEIGAKIIFASHINLSHYEWEISHPNEIAPPLGVEDFLSYIANAELVLTDSFHAAAFSAIYRTPFYVLPRFNAVDRNSMNSRVVDLVEELQIPNRFTKYLTEKYEWSNEELNSITRNINRLRRRGLAFLGKFLCIREE